MAIRNTNLGGTDWATSDTLSSTDLNDTIDTMANFAKTLSCFWLNSSLRDLYDDFSSYTTDADVPGTLWTTTITDSTHCTFKTRASTNAGGSSKEGELKAIAPNDLRTFGTAKTITSGFVADTHKFMKLYIYLHMAGSNYSDCYTHVSFNKESNWDVLLIQNVTSDTNDVSTTKTILVLAQGSNEYDCYIDGKFIRTVTDADFQITFRAQAANTSNDAQSYALIDITDIYESSGTM